MNLVGSSAQVHTVASFAPFASEVPFKVLCGEPELYRILCSVNDIGLRVHLFQQTEQSYCDDIVGGGNYCVVLFIIRRKVEACIFIRVPR